MAKIGSVEAVIDICDDPDNKNEIFYKIPIEIVIKALNALQEVGKAQVSKGLLIKNRYLIQNPRTQWELSSFIFEDKFEIRFITN